MKHLILLVLVVLAASSAFASELDLTCEDVRHAVDQCQFVKDYCQDDRLGYIDYLGIYYCAVSPVLKGFLLTAFISWLVVLFMVIGVAASDYLCPNLNTISKMLGLSESLAGVTFLALGNGSPDVFSTYAAMKIGSGSLAIGELVGAASFITAVVTGSMAIIRPFKVAKKSFLRDVVFFTIAVSYAMYSFSDGVLTSFECAVMLLIYVAYVIFVVCWHWYNSRRRRLYLVETRARDLFSEPGHEATIEADEEIADNPSVLTQGLNFSGLNLDSASFSNSSPLSGTPLWQEQTEEQQGEGYNELTRVMRLRRGSVNPLLRTSQNSSSTSSSPTGNTIRPSLFGALEFRNVLQNLNDSRSVKSFNIPLEVTQSSETSSSTQPVTASEFPSESSLGYESAQSRSASYSNQRANSYDQSVDIPHLIVTDEQDEEVDDVFEHDYSPTDYERAVSPDLDHYSDNPRNSLLGDHVPISMLRRSSHSRGSLLQEKVFYKFKPFFDVVVILCPTLDGFTKKSLMNKIICVITAPAIFLLTITVPVIESDAIEKEEGTTDYDPRTTSLPVIQTSKVYITVVRWLLIIQAFCGPLFTVVTGFADGEVSITKLIGYSSMISIVLVVLIGSTITEPYRAPYYMQLISFAGFIFAIAWVSAVANEVVGVLKALGIVFHISDAILGLTVFAVGNSLGDLVANMTVAKMGFPMMALSACFGGPMLNILVGVGVSGLVVMPPGGFEIGLSHTLVISGITLLLTLVFLLVSVPLNKWRLSRTLGMTTVLFWVVATTINVVLEVVIK